MELNLYEIVSQYVNLPLTAVCVMIGWLLKHVWEDFNTKLIPLILLPIGIIGELWLNDWSFVPSVIMTGICSVAMAVYLHSTGKHIFEAIPKN